MLERACEEFRKTNLPISDIAYELGFRRQGAFTAQFRNGTKLTPNKYCG